MSVTGSVSHWLATLQEENSSSLGKIWNRYHVPLLERARLWLGRFPRRMADEEDLVASAFDSFFTSARRCRFPSLKSRRDLWRLLLCITERKMINLVRSERCQKRGGGQVRGGSAMQDSEGLDFRWIGHVTGSPLDDAVVRDTFEKLMASVDENMRQMVVLKLEGYEVVEIARRVARSVATVERRLRIIRDRWEQEFVQ